MASNTQPVELKLSNVTEGIWIFDKQQEYVDVTPIST